MPIIPDTKDWTWVLERPCPECSFDANSVARSDLARMYRQNAREWPHLLARPDARARPDAATWSPLEYAAHVRDVFRLGSYRTQLMLDASGASFPNWNQDETAAAEHYELQDPQTVVGEIAEAAEQLASLVESIQGDYWDHTGRRSDGATFTVATFLTYVLHDPIHHAWDVRHTEHSEL